MLKIWISQKLTVYLSQKVKGIDAYPIQWASQI